MARQGELFPNPEVAVALDSSRGEPRLWVRRLVIWEKPGEIIREVRLRRGLNIIWSPDPGAGLADLGRDAGSGHGAGKTLFCRLLRYCLGEDGFSNEDLRKSIAGLLPGGLVGAELVIQGRPWAVVRPIGQTRKHVVREGGTLEDIADLKETGTGIGPLLTALEERLFPAGIEEYLPGERQHAAWLFALAWLSRDQECRFDHILDWRHRRADTGSIAVGPPKDQLLIVVRALLGVIGKEELRLKADREGLSEKKSSLERDLGYFQRRVEQINTEFVRAPGVNLDAIASGELALTLFRDEVEKKLRDLEQQDIAEGRSDPMAPYRREREGVLKEIAVLEKDTEQLKATQELHEEQLKVLRGERSNLDAAELKARLGPVCPVCRVPIDQALATGCGLSHTSWDPTSVIDEKRLVAQQTAACNEAIARAKRLTSEQQSRLNGLNRREAEITVQMDALAEKARNNKRQRRQQWFGAKQLVEKVSEFQTAQTDTAKAKQSLQDLARRDEELANLQVQLRNRHSDTLSRLGDLFSYVCRGLLGNQVRASLVLSGQGLKADVEVGGMAMESLKTIAFDLAALLMSIEGRTTLPAFLVHDSPREADLGEAIYHRLFRLMQKLECLSGEAPFQYIITTTTKPPQELCQEPFLVAKLEGAEVDGRLLRRNLGGLEV
jgi:hypothetical protein